MAVLDALSDAALRAREDFLSGLAPRDPVRADILASWRRSLFSGASPDLPALPYDDDHLDEESRLQWSARPVLDTLAEQLDGSTAALLLADADARIVGRWVGSDNLARVMDRTSSAPGFSLVEETCGTNGLGSVVEEGRLFHVTGAEHYADRFLGYSCCGAPILNPISGRLDGVVTLVCPGEDANGLMAPIVLQAVSAIQRRIGEQAGHQERQLLATFLARQHGTRRPLVAINERAVISTPAAARALAPDQLAVLWEHVAEVVANRCSDRVELRATDDRAVVCDCSPLIEDGVVHGALVEFGPVAERRPAVSEAGGTGPTALRLGGASRGWRQIVREADRLARSPLPLLVAGPPGTGKLELVRAMHHQAIERERCAVLDAALSSVDVPDKWLTHLIDLLAGDDDVVVVRHLDQLDARMANVLSTVMDHRSGRTTNRVVATMTTEGSSCSPALAALLDRFAHRIDLPALGERRDEIPDIAHALVERHRPGSGRRFVGEALQVLMRANWPGNVRQLETAVLGALQWRDTGDVTVEDLPRHLVSRSTSGLTPIQQAELKAIVAALRASEGNKQEAAASLGIARSTLYRKLRQFGLDLDRLAY